MCFTGANTLTNTTVVLTFYDKMSQETYDWLEEHVKCRVD